MEEQLVDSILEGKYLRNDSANHFETVYRNFCENAVKGEEEKMNIYAKSELERVESLKEFFAWIPVPDSYFKGKSIYKNCR